ncbi:hypothetical protein [Saccharomonospora halophila]|uniref:hypothetical protein n=1 Tax=Saccharomonospora halophila TaxID=129922 RepID=UPI00036B3F77|nr:hypothetical protein [Saccharomonospora halophila]
MPPNAHAPPDDDEPPDSAGDPLDETTRLPALPVADTVVLHNLGDHWPSVDPDVDPEIETARAKRALQHHEPPSASLLRRVLHGLRQL